MSNFISFTKHIEEISNQKLANELIDVQIKLNTDNNYKTNLAVINNMDYAISLIKDIVNDNLSFVKGDYYIYPSFGGKPAIVKTPNGMVKAMTSLAYKKGFFCSINMGCVFRGYEALKITRSGAIDKIELINSPESEISRGEIIAPYCMISLFTLNTKDLVSQKLTIIRNNEYINAKNQSKTPKTHRDYPVPMAQKIALKRAVSDLLATFGYDDGKEYLRVHEEINDHNKDYNLKEKPDEAIASKETEPDMKKPTVEVINESQAKIINNLAEEKGVLLSKVLSKFHLKSLEEMTLDQYKLSVEIFEKKPDKPKIVKTPNV